jgi:SAM-dependent methyltransferase
VSGGARSLAEAPDRDGHAARQWSYFKAADEAKFRWQTTGPLFAPSERQLVSVAAGEGSLLEVGCGEGGNLFHLGPGDGLRVGIDYSMAKAVFAAGALPWARLACGDAVRLPFRRGVFQRVLCRDLLHHLRAPEQRAAVAEMFRVCRPGGEVVVIEPNGRNPLIGAFALLVPAERGMLRSTPERIAGLVKDRAARISLSMAQPLPVARGLLHYRFGRPALGRRRVIARLLGVVDAALTRLVPQRLWAYIVLRAVPPEPAAGGAGDPVRARAES